MTTTTTDHDHSLCTVAEVEVDEGKFELVASLPSADCGWESHDDAVAEAGSCPVCQH